MSARFDRTRAEFKGSVAESGEASGKIASIDMWTNNGRVEDILRLFISGKTAPVTGAFTFAGHLDMPPGPEPFLRKIKMSGDFGVTGGKFANKETETDLTR